MSDWNINQEPLRETNYKNFKNEFETFLQEQPEPHLNFDVWEDLSSGSSDPQLDAMHTDNYLEGLKLKRSSYNNDLIQLAILETLIDSLEAMKAKYGGISLEDAYRLHLNELDNNSSLGIIQQIILTSSVSDTENPNGSYDTVYSQTVKFFEILHKNGGKVFLRVESIEDPLIAQENKGLKELVEDDFKSGLPIDLLPKLNLEFAKDVMEEDEEPYWSINGFNDLIIIFS